MKRIKLTMLILILSFSIQISYSQKVELDNNISFEIEKIKYKTTTRGGQGWVSSPKGYKYLILDLIYYNNFGKKNKFQLSDMIFKTDKETYKVRPYATAGVEEVKNWKFYVRKKRKDRIFFVVDDDFTKGVLFFKDKAVFEISVPKGTKVGKFRLIKN